MEKPPIIAPSVLACDLNHMAREVERVQNAGAGMIHVDIMDGHFVPNLALGVPIVSALRRATDLPLDVHLMVSNPIEELPWYIEAGADYLTLHEETVTEVQMMQAIETMREAGVKPGVSVKPKTNPSALASYLPSLSLALVMSVEPGFAGQDYIEGTELKVATIKAMADELGCPDLIIEVDGGIDEMTIGRCYSAGANAFVCGKAVFGAEDPAAALTQITTAALAAVA